MSADYIERTVIDRATTAVLAIDPGINGTGWALWRSVEDSTSRRVPRVAPDEVGVLRKRHASFVETSAWLADELRAVTGGARWLCSVHGLHFCGCGKQPRLTITCEFPEFQTSAARSMGWMRGDLQKLCYLVGALGYMAASLDNRDIMPTTFEPVPVSQWKGQLPKDVVERRIVEKLTWVGCKKLDIKTHAWDAVGIGLWRLGVFA